MILYFPLFVTWGPFKTRHVFEKPTPISFTLETTTVFDVPHRQSPGGGWRKRIQGGSPAKGGTTKYRAASEAHTSRVGRSVPEYLPPIWRIPTEKCKKKQAEAMNIHESWTFMWGCHVTRAWRGHRKHWFSLIYIYNLCSLESSLHPYGGSTLPSTSSIALPTSQGVFNDFPASHGGKRALQQQRVTLDSAIGAKASASVSTGRCWILVAVGMVVTHVRKRHLQPKLFEGTRMNKVCKVKSFKKGFVLEKHHSWTIALPAMCFTIYCLIQIKNTDFFQPANAPTKDASPRNGFL